MARNTRVGEGSSFWLQVHILRRLTRLDRTHPPSLDRQRIAWSGSSAMTAWRLRAVISSPPPPVFWTLLEDLVEETWVGDLVAELLVVPRLPALSFRLWPVVNPTVLSLPRPLMAPLVPSWRGLSALRHARPLRAMAGPTTFRRSLSTRARSDTPRRMLTLAELQELRQESRHIVKTGTADIDGALNSPVAPRDFNRTNPMAMGDTIWFTQGFSGPYYGGKNGVSILYWKQDLSRLRPSFYDPVTLIHDGSVYAEAIGVARNSDLAIAAKR